RCAIALRALPLETDGLPVLDKGGQLDGDLAAIGKLGRHLRCRCRFLDADTKLDIDVLTARSLAPAFTARRTRALLAGDGIAENVTAKILAESFAAGTIATELKMRPSRPLLAPESGKGIAAGRALETLEQRLAVRADLATVEGCALLLVADD